MKTKKFLKIFKTKKEAPAMPDLAAYTDDILGPSMADPIQEVPAKIKMLTRKRKVAPFLPPGMPEEENEEGELVSDMKDSAPKKPRKPRTPRIKLSNREQALQHGFNPDAEQHADKWEQFKNVSVTSIPNMIASGVSQISPIALNYHQVKDLPGYIRTPMVAIEKALFKFLTKTPVNDIQTLADVGTKGPNSDEEMNAVEKWITLKSKTDSELAGKVQKRFHGVVLKQTEGITHLLVNNSTGRFIFSWPSTDSHTE